LDCFIERGLIQLDKRNNPFVLIPILLRREKLLEGDNKNTRFLGLDMDRFVHILVLTLGSFCFEE
jgi:hypothetical protein